MIGCLASDSRKHCQHGRRETQAAEFESNLLLNIYRLEGGGPRFGVIFHYLLHILKKRTSGDPHRARGYYFSFIGGYRSARARRPWAAPFDGAPGKLFDRQHAHVLCPALCRWLVQPVE
jgi:hypothetical protein